MAPLIWQGELPARTFTFGAGTMFEIAETGPSGLGTAVRFSDTDRLPDGSAMGLDAIPAREIQIPFHLGEQGSTDLECGALVQQLRTAWRTPRRGELQLDLYAPGILTVAVASFYGRPRGCTVDLARVHAGYASALATFAATDPLMYGPAVTGAVDSSSPLMIDDTTLGPEDTDRAVLTVVGNAGTPTITNTTTGGVIDFASALATADVAVLNLRTRQVTVEGVAAPEVIDPASSWFRLAGGVDNTLTFTGAASIQVTYRPAYP